MRAIVIGAGEVGYDVARILSREDHDVVVVDTDPAMLERARDTLDVLTIHGSGTSADVLGTCGIGRADMVVAVTAVDEVNVIACMLASRLGVTTTVARVRSDELAGAGSILKAADFGISLVIQPEESAAAEIVRLIRRSAATDVLSFAGGRLQLVGVRLDRETPVLDETMAEVSARMPGVPFRIMAIVRGARTILPGGAERLRSGDQVFVMARPRDLPHVTRLLGKDESRLQHVMILGGTATGARIAQQLAEISSKRVKLVESDRARAQRLSELLGGVLVLHGDGTDIDLLAREGLGEMDAFVAVTDDEESNLVTCLIAKHLGVRKTVGLLSKSAYIPIAASIGLDAAVSKKLAVSREVLRYLRGKNVLSVGTVHGMDAEILELEAAPRAAVTRGPLADVRVPSGVLISAVIHQASVEIATGTTEIRAGDRAIVFVLPRAVEAAQKFFAR
jgi:trk system potassium uptake protein TrkA